MLALVLLCQSAQATFVRDGTKVKSLEDIGTYAAPTIGMDGTIYMPTAGAYNSSVIAVNPNGTTKWKFTVLPVHPRVDFPNLQEMTVSSPVTLGLNNDLLYAPASDGNLYALDIRTGMAQWRFRPWGDLDLKTYCNYLMDYVCPMVSKVLVHTDGSLYFKADVSVYHVAPTGESLWWRPLPDHYPTDSCGEGDYLSEHVELADSVLYVHTSCHFFAIDAVSGEIMWNQTAYHYGDAPRMGKDGNLYALTRPIFDDSYLLRFNATNVSVVAELEGGGDKRILLDDDLIYVSASESVQVFDTFGMKRWNRTFWDGSMDDWVSSPVICGDTLYVTTSNVCFYTDDCDAKGRWGQLRALDVKTGAEKWSVTPDFSPLYDCSACEADLDSVEPCGAFCNANMGTEPVCADDGSIYFGMTKESLFEGRGHWILLAAASPNGTLLWSFSDWDVQSPFLV